MGKLNCWEFTKCGREIGGAKIKELGMCPAAIDTASNTLNSGKNGGRSCWIVSGTSCGTRGPENFTQKQSFCMACELFKLVKSEE